MASTTVVTNGGERSGTRVNDLEGAEPFEDEAKYVSKEQIEELENLEEMKTLICHEKHSFEKKCAEVKKFYIHNICMYVMVVGVGLLLGAYLHDQHQVLIVITLLIITFLVGMGVSTYAAFALFKSLEWNIVVMESKRTKLWKSVVSFSKRLVGVQEEHDVTLSDAHVRVSTMLNTLQKETDEGSHMDYVDLTSATAITLIAVACWIYFSYGGCLHTARDT